MRITENFQLEELFHSDKAAQLKIDNSPPPVAMARLVIFTIDVLQPVRSLLGSPVVITSGYRCPKLNRIVGGSPNSQHTLGEAVDMQCGSLDDLKKLYKLLCATNKCDQVLLEHNAKGVYWVHCSYKHEGGNRHDYRDNYLSK